MSDDATTAPAENNVAPSSERKNRTSMASRATAEGEALLKEMGFEDKETPGRRRTRSAIRGDVYTPPTKKEKKASTPAGTGRRGRPPKKTEEKKEEPVDEEEENKEEKAKDVEKEKEEEKGEDKEKEEDEASAEATKETEKASADGKAEEEKEDKKEDKKKDKKKAE